MEIGKYHTLEIARLTPPGAYLVNDAGEEILLPKRYLTPEMEKGHSLTVFVYKDSEDRPVATTETPLVFKNEFACLRVKDTNQAGAFLDWGLQKDLFVPFKEQEKKMRTGHWHLVYMYLDPRTERLVASAKIYKFADREITLEEGAEVELIIGPTNEYGVQVIVENKYLGLLYENEIFEELLLGEKKKGFVKKVRDDGKMDISLRKTGLEHLEEGSKKIMKLLQSNKGTIPLHDKSDPEDIQELLQMSKKSFKRSLGLLYKKKLVKIEEQSISLNSQ